MATEIRARLQKVANDVVFSMPDATHGQQVSTVDSHAGAGAFSVFEIEEALAEAKKTF